MDGRGNRKAEFAAVFAARGWLTEHPAAFRDLLMAEGVPVKLGVGAHVFRRDDPANGLYGVLSGAVGIEGGHRRQTPLLNHILRRGEWFGIKSVLGGGPRELATRLGNWIARDLQTTAAGRRLASVLYRVLGAGEVQPDEPEGFRLTQNELVEMAVLSRYHVGRKLAAFEAAGWIACGSHRIRLLEPEGLAAFAYSDEER